MRHQPRALDGCEFHIPDDFEVVIQQIAGHLQPKACFADSTGADQRQQANCGQQPPELGNRPLAPDEARQVDREIVQQGGALLREGALLLRPGVSIGQCGGRLLWD